MATNSLGNEIKYNKQKEFLEKYEYYSGIFLYKSPKIKNDDDEIIVAIKQTGKIYNEVLKYASNRIINDKQIAFAAVSKDGLFLEYLSNNLKDDKEVVMEAVSENGFALEFASRRLQDDKEIVLSAVNKKGNALEYASKELQNDKEVVLAAVINDGWSLKYTSDELKNKYGSKPEEFVKNLEAELNPKNIISLDDSLENILKKLEDIKPVKLEVVKPSNISNSNETINDNNSIEIDNIKKKSNNHRL